MAQDSNITRRTFVAGSALAGVAAGSTALTSVATAEEAAPAPAPTADPQAWLGEEPAIPESFDLELECDVVVCGLGLAGVSATRMAVEQGASVVAFEKGSDYGLGSKDMCAIGSKTFVERFPEIEPYWRDGAALLQNEIAKNCLYRNNASLTAKWLEINGEAVDWYISALPEDQVSIGTSENGNHVDNLTDCTLAACSWPLPANYDPYEENIPCLPGSYNLAGAKNKGWLDANLTKAIEEAGDALQVFRNTRVTRLLHDDGVVSGVIAVADDGTVIKATAAKGVVLATGDFINDQAMMERFLPTVLEGGYIPNGPMAYYRIPDKDGLNTDTGDGHRMAVWAGARMQAYACSMTHFGGGGNSSVFGTVPYLLLDLLGNRFMNEDVQGQQYAEQIRQHPGMVGIQVFDSAWESQLADMPYGHGKFTTRGQADIDQRLENGTLFCADTLEELLANFEGMDVENAIRSIERYNELCAGGVDLDFAKTPKRMFPVENPPYYAAAFSRGDDLVTMSGIECDTECRALDANYQPIPGLYVAGNVQGGRFASIYPEVALGISVAMAMAFGREAGKNAANA